MNPNRKVYVDMKLLSEKRREVFFGTTEDARKHHMFGLTVCSALECVYTHRAPLRLLSSPPRPLSPSHPFLSAIFFEIEKIEKIKRDEVRDDNDCDDKDDGGGGGECNA